MVQGEDGVGKTEILVGLGFRRIADSRDSLQWQQEAEFQKSEGSGIMCTSKCYICDQGKKHQRKQYEQMM